MMLFDHFSDSSLHYFRKRIHLQRHLFNKTIIYKGKLFYSCYRKKVILEIDELIYFTACLTNQIVI